MTCEFLQKGLWEGRLRPTDHIGRHDRPQASFRPSTKILPPSKVRAPCTTPRCSHVHHRIYELEYAVALDPEVNDSRSGQMALLSREYSQLPPGPKAQVPRKRVWRFFGMERTVSWLRFVWCHCAQIEL